MLDALQVYHRDVCELGFKDELNGCADAVFLDLPAPQVAVPHALKALKDSGKNIFNFPVLFLLSFNSILCSKAEGFARFHRVSNSPNDVVKR